MGVQEAPMGVKVKGKEVEGGAVMYNRTTEVVGMKSGIIRPPDSQPLKELRLPYS